MPKRYALLKPPGRHKPGRRCHLARRDRKRMSLCKLERCVHQLLEPVTEYTNPKRTAEEWREVLGKYLCTNCETISGTKNG